MERLPVTNATVSAGVVEKISGNDTGVRLIGNARSAGSFSATVQLLTEIKDIVGACAYASNYPPVVEFITSTRLEFTGTPMYNLVLKHQNNETDTIYRVSGAIYDLPENYSLVSFTDKTGAPGIIVAHAVDTPPYAASAQTWTFGSSLTWSDRIASTQINCQQVNTMSSSGTQTLYAVIDNKYYYNWYCLDANRSQFCPDPWRIPTKEDFEELVIVTTYEVIEAAWTTPGCLDAGNSSPTFGATYVALWTVTLSASNPYWIYTGFDSISIQTNKVRQTGLTIVCVR
jgi:hypothetical protein